jgi:hypothetical protein
LEYGWRALALRKAYCAVEKLNPNAQRQVEVERKLDMHMKVRTVIDSGSQATDPPARSRTSSWLFGA